MDGVQKEGIGEIWRKISLYGDFGAILNTFQIDVEFLILGEQKGCRMYVDAQFSKPFGPLMRITK